MVHFQTLFLMLSLTRSKKSRARLLPILTGSRSKDISMNEKTSKINLLWLCDQSFFSCSRVCFSSIFFSHSDSCLPSLVRSWIPLNRNIRIYVFWQTRPNFLCGSDQNNNKFLIFWWSWVDTCICVFGDTKEWILRCTSIRNENFTANSIVSKK